MTTRIKLNDIKLDRAAAAPLLGTLVRIWSAEHHVWWRPKRCGYTVHEMDAGIYTWDDAYAATQHCGPEKRIEYEIVTGRPNAVNILPLACRCGHSWNETLTMPMLMGEFCAHIGAIRCAACGGSSQDINLIRGAGTRPLDQAA